MPQTDETITTPPAVVRRTLPYERIKQAILAGELAPGQPLTESALAAWCGVSRTPIRESLTRLQEDGLIERTSRGLVVREISPEEVLDIYDTRVVLESSAARFAADRRTTRDILEMKHILEMTAEIDPDDLDAMQRYETNAAFHRVVWRASHNASLIDLLERLNVHLGRHSATTLSYPGRWADATREHALIVEAIVNHDGPEAARLSAQHFNEARDIRLRLYVETTTAQRR